MNLQDLNRERDKLFKGSFQKFVFKIWERRFKSKLENFAKGVCGKIGFGCF